MRRLLLGLGVMMTSAVIGVPSAQASYPGPAPGVADVVATPGSTVFIGTVVELANGEGWPTFAVNATTVEGDEPSVPRGEPEGGDDSPPYVMIALTTVLVAGGCLYLLFRRGSIAYRARQDDERSSES